MTETTTDRRDCSVPVLQNWPGGKPAWVLVAVIALGDFLLWWHFPVLSLVLFLTALVMVHLVLHGRRANRLQIVWSLIVHGVGILPLVETLNILTFLSGVTGAFAACLILRGSLTGSWPQRLDIFVTSALTSPARFWSLVFGNRHNFGVPNGVFRSVRNWVWPVLLASVFIWLFANANPIWETWLQEVDVMALVSLLFSDRSLFWLGLAWFSWPFLERRAPVRKALSSLRRLVDLTVPSVADGPKPAAGDGFFERSLILFNLVFAAQTLLDLTYLWGGFQLPDGMTYASYAHRGAYPLVAAAIMAAVFVVIAMRPGGPGERIARIKWLVLAWVAQNLLLVASSMLRLDIYIEVYALTYWRIAALIWMGLVAVGLVLIVSRFALGRTTGWLITANVFALAATLYATSFLNFPDVIARYNLAHGHQYRPAPELRYDGRYIVSLGALALPAVLEFRDSQADLSLEEQRWLERVEQSLRLKVDHEVGTDWRTWSFRGQRLKWFLEARQGAIAAPSKPRETGPAVP